MQLAGCVRRRIDASESYLTDDTQPLIRCANASTNTGIRQSLSPRRHVVETQGRTGGRGAAWLRVLRPVSTMSGVRHYMLTCVRPGAFVISFGLPLLCYAFVFLCNDISGCPAPSLLHPSSFSLEQLKREVGWPGISGLVTTNAVLGTLGYYLLSLTLYAFLPATKTEGTVLRNGSRLKYRFNGKSSHVFGSSPPRAQHCANAVQLSARPSSP